MVVRSTLPLKFTFDKQQHPTFILSIPEFKGVHFDTSSS